MAAVKPAPRIAVLASGRGSNLQALIDAIAAGTLAAELVAVFSDRPLAPALTRARDAGIPACVREAGGYPSRAEFDDALFADVAAVEPDFVVCAGYLRLLGAHVVEPWLGRMINIHPSLLPAFKGLHTHRQALDAGVATHGASVHFVTPVLVGGWWLVLSLKIPANGTNSGLEPGVPGTNGPDIRQSGMPVWGNGMSAQGSTDSWNPYTRFDPFQSRSCGRP